MADPWGESAAKESASGESSSEESVLQQTPTLAAPRQQSSDPAPTLATQPRQFRAEQYRPMPKPTPAEPEASDRFEQAPSLEAPTLAPPKVNPLDDPLEDLRMAERDRPTAEVVQPAPSVIAEPTPDVLTTQTEPFEPQDDLPSPQASLLSQLSKCEEDYENYQGDDRDCVIAKCELTEHSIFSVSLSLRPDGDELPYECVLEDPLYAGRHWLPTTFTWKASALCHKPLYFEEVKLERYGHTVGPVLQSALSGAHFFANIAVLPYKIGMNPCSECRYALGYYRPGSCAPWLIDPIPFSRRGALLQSAAVLGVISVIP